MRLAYIMGATLLSGSLVVAQPRSARACGGCFHPPSPPTNPMTTIVTAHRMAFAFSPTRTVLWDQIQYDGNPRDFSWVLPVRGDAKLETADDAWFDSLEAVTSTRLSPPQLNCFNAGSSSSSSCTCVGFGGSADDSSAAGAVPTGGTTIPPGVMVEHEGTVGPYQFVQLTATNSQSLESWLADNQYVVPPEVQPVVDAYVNDGFGFIALKLQPTAGIREMKPVRVITPGASPTLPLRMVAAGTGAQVAITLYVIAEGRYEPDGPAMVSVDFTKLSWDWNKSASNYSTLRQAALASGDGAGWLTTFAQRQAFTASFVDPLGQQVTFTPNTTTAPPSGVGFGSFSKLSDLYFAQASANAKQTDLCPKLDVPLNSSSLVVDTCHPAPESDAGAPSGGPSSTADAGGDAAQDATAARDATPDVLPAPAVVCDPTPAGSLAARDFECQNFSDIGAAMIGMHPADVWITRLEANLPHANLSDDLRIHPAPDQVAVTQLHRAVTHVNPPCDLLENHPMAALLPGRDPGDDRRGHAGIGFVSAAVLLAVRRAAKRRRD